MLATRRKARMIAALALALVATSMTAPTTSAGPISDMLARHRQARALRLPPMDKPFQIKNYKDPNARRASLTQRFKQRYALRKAGMGSTKDQSVIKTKR